MIKLLDEVLNKCIYPHPLCTAPTEKPSGPIMGWAFKQVSSQN